MSNLPPKQVSASISHDHALFTLPHQSHLSINQKQAKTQADSKAAGIIESHKEKTMKNTNAKSTNLPLILLIASLAAVILGGVYLVFNLHTPNQNNGSASLAVETAPPEPTVPVLAPVEPTAPPEPTPAPTAVPAVDPVDFVNSIIDPNQYRTWISQLSGEESVLINGQESKIDTRYSYAMFSGQNNAKAHEYMLQTIRQFIPEEQITVEPYTYVDGMGANTWYNIIVTFPGQTHPEQQVLFTAHYDSCVVFEGNPLEYAPGANDNGTGVATLLEALRAFNQMKFGKTLKLVFFTGEENFQQGSKAYVEQHAGDQIVGVINMDMFGTDKDGDRCLELYVGGLTGSQELANLFLNTIQKHQLNLKADYLISNAYDLADQKSFWEKEIAAITVMENFLPDYSPGGCETGMDRTDHWHLPGDKLEAVNLEYAFDIGRAGIYTVLELAEAQPVTR